MTKGKTKKCALKSCGKDFLPKSYWQKYHTQRCAWTANNKKNMALIRRAKKSIKEKQKQEQETEQANG